MIVGVCDSDCDVTGQSENSLLLARVCGRQHQNRYTTSQQAMYVHFKANSHTGSKGFRFRLRSWTCESLSCIFAEVLPVQSAVKSAYQEFDRRLSKVR